MRVLELSTTAADAGDLAAAREIAADLPLMEVAAIAGHPRPTIDVRVRDDGVRTVQHIERPRSIALEQTPDGTVFELRIDDTGGTTTLVQFRNVLPPEMLDGLAARER